MADGEQEAQTGPEGRFRIRGMEPGTYTLHVSALGWSTARIDADSAGPLRIELSRRPVGVEGVEVRTSRRRAEFPLIEHSLGMAIPAEELRALLHPAEDPFRALRLLPGVAANEFSSRLHVRGGDPDALRVRLDGLDVVDPFHLREAGGVTSMVDEAALASAELRTGALPASDPTGGASLELETRGSRLTETRG